jgi:hypothetical protein
LLWIAVCSVAFCTQTSAQDLVAGSSPDPSRIVFVCEHGSVKSLVAAMYSNHRAQQQELAYRAVARGTAPEALVPRAVSDVPFAELIDDLAKRKTP